MAWAFGDARPVGWIALAELGARLREGIRVSAAASRQLGLYRPSSIRHLQLLGGDLDSPVASEMLDHERVGIGDVVLSKFLPVRTAWVTPSTTRRGVDANCIRITGLAEHVGFWAAAVLEHPDYQLHVSHLAAGATIPRIGLRDLKSLRVPAAPAEVRALSARWVVAADAAARASEELTALQEEIDAAVDAEAPEAIDENEPRLYSPTEIGDGWVPAQAARSRFALEVRSRSGWTALGRFASRYAGRMRGSPGEALRLLRLGDAGGALGFELPDPEELRQASFRIYEEPLRSEEVLLSVLGTSPKVIFNFPPREEEIWVADHWFRLSARDAPGVLALVLRTKPVIWQLSRMASGLAQQYIARTDLVEVAVPVLNGPVVREWEERLRRVLQATAGAQAELDAIYAETQELIGRQLAGK